MSYWYLCFFFFKQKTAYEMRISDWSSDVCSSDLVSEPTKGSVMILKARAEVGASSLEGRLMTSSVSGFTPFTSCTSVGDGRKSTTASSSGCTPLFLNAVPHSTGTNFRPQVPLRMQRLRVYMSGSRPEEHQSE